MSRNRELFDAVGALFLYPNADTDAAMRTALGAAETSPDKATARLFSFIGDFEALDGAAREELYTRTFDVNPIASLEIGWQLFGESYDRGGYLVRMRALLRDAGIAEGTELPDHVAYALPLYSRLADEARARALAVDEIGPALTKMLEGFKDAENPYRHLLLAALEFLSAEIGGSVAFQGCGTQDVPRAAEPFEC